MCCVGRCWGVELCSELNCDDLGCRRDVLCFARARFAVRCRREL